MAQEHAQSSGLAPLSREPSADLEYGCGQSFQQDIEVLDLAVAGLGKQVGTLHTKKLLG